MPQIDTRFADPEEVALRAVPPATDTTSPSVLQTSTSGNFMSVGGNTVPMRGVLPVEHMTDTDLYRFYPYSAYVDRVWDYRYFALANRT